jgi:YVTN family beta-propeller protein
MRKVCFFLVAGLVMLGGCARFSSEEPRSASSSEVQGQVWPGQQADGSMLLPNQWSLRPAGEQIPLADFPVNMALHPDGRFVAVLHSGFSAHEVWIIDLPALSVVDKARVKESFYGLEFDASGERLYCSGAGQEVIYAFEFNEGKLENRRAIRLRDVEMRGIPAGLAVDNSGKRLFAANVSGHVVSMVDLGGDAAPKEIRLAPEKATTDSRLFPEQQERDFDEAAALKRAEAAQEVAPPTTPHPYACRVDGKRNRLYVSLWARSSVAVIDLKKGTVVDHWHTQEHPCEMVLSKSGRHLYVANANRNTVSVFDTDSGKNIETIWAALYPDSPEGSTPNSLALSPDEKTLFVANACNNVIAVVDVSKPGRSRSLGFIPSGWYPTSVRVTRDGKHLLVANGKGLNSRANPLGPQPGQRTRRMPTVEYIAGLFHGTLSVIKLPAGETFAKEMAAYTAQAYECSPLKPGAQVSAPRPADNPIPAKVGGASPIEYCIYIIKENRTYDQVLGDIPEGKGDPSLCLFPEEVTPNQHKLVREFVLLDNFYVESEVSADGHEWSMGAYATDFVEKMWPMSYGHNQAEKYAFPAEGNFRIAAPSGGYLWDKAKEAGVSYRSYGEFIVNGRTPKDPATTRIKALKGHFDPWFRGFDMGYSDLDRAKRFISELKRFEREGEMPRLQIVRLPNDHTRGVAKGFKTPRAFVAENDLAMGMVMEAVSQSKFWAKTAVFVVEDDAQNGPDHVDAHRTTAYVVSPYTKRKFVDSTMYSTASMLRTMELILGLQPMSQFDAAARPMYHSFQATPDLAPFKSVPARVDLEEMNDGLAWGADVKMNFAKEDAADDLLLNEIVWRSVRGRDSEMPAPVRASFVFAVSEEGDEDED